MSGSAQKSLFCFGYGYSCDWLGHALRQLGGWNLAGTTRDPEKRRQMKEHGIRAFLFDYDQPLEDPLLFLRGTTHLLISTPADDDGDPTFHLHAEDILRLETLEWVGYLSSTAVYGDREGGWVDEESELRPNSKRGSRRLRAEQQWMSLWRDYDLPVEVFRLAGIYGPGRSALDSVRAGVARRINKPGHAFSRIHVDDIVQVLLASMQQPRPGNVYNLADDRAAPSHEVIAHACELLGLTPPPLLQYDEADLAPITRSFYSDNKRIRNEKIKQTLGVNLRHPTFVEGLRACLAAEESGLEMIAAASGVEGGM